MTNFDGVRALTFDLFGTVLDLDGSLVPPLGRFFDDRGIDADAGEFWQQWRSRQRIEQYQDTILMLGHSGYLATCERALRYTLRLNRIDLGDGAEAEIMGFWQELKPYAGSPGGAPPASPRRYDLVALSNGNAPFLQHLAANRIGWDFDAVISVGEVGSPSSHTRRSIATPRPGWVSSPAECLMVSANSFDVLGARACGYRAAFVNRRDVPYEDSPLQPDLTVPSFTELAEALL